MARVISLTLLAAASASAGDIIEIAAGTYLLEESVGLITGATIRVRTGPNGEPATILDGQGQVLVLGTAYADQSLFENLVLTNGYGDYGGGARFVASDDVVVRNCHFVGNHANWEGAGIRMSLGSAVTLVDCEVTGNIALTPSGQGKVVVRRSSLAPETPLLFLTELGSAATPMAWADRKSLVESPSISADVSLITVTHV